MLKNVPEEIDYNEFKWLRNGDRIRIADKTGMSESTVRASLKKRSFNIEVLTEAMKIVCENKKQLMEFQAQAKALSKG